MAANSNIQISDLDFDSIKDNLKTFLRSQDKFKDYDFEGSGLSVLMDLLAYNTHYNAYYLNMVANEMFMDTAALRSSVVSHAKLLNYTPRSVTAPRATITLQVNELNTPSYTLPKFTKFQSQAIDGINYTYITKDAHTENAVNGTATFNNLQIYQGEPISLTFTYDEATNLKQLFVLPDANIDTSTLNVRVQASVGNTSVTTYTLATDVTNLDGSSTNYFLQEGLNGQYEIYFGDNVLGKKLTDGNIVLVSYIVSEGTSSSGANSFVLLDSVASGNNVIIPYTPAVGGMEKESIESIKFNAPKAYSAQGRAVTKEDYIALLNNNNLGFSFDAVNVWSGTDNDPPIYGQVFISAKPAGGYSLTQTQKDILTTYLLKPASVLTVTPVFLNPDYTYITISAKVLYDPTKTTLTAGQMTTKVTDAIKAFADSTLNTFNSTFSLSDLNIAIKQCDLSIITDECEIKLEKKFYPLLNQYKNYNLNFGTQLKKDVSFTGMHTSPTMQYFTNEAPVTLIEDVYTEEVPQQASTIKEISLINPGYGYSETPSVVIEGDGFGASAVAEVINGSVNKITLLDGGVGYSQALVKIVNDPTDTNGAGAYATATIDGQFGTMRSYYYDNNNNDVKTILNDNIATIDYINGIVTLNNFSPYQINNALGRLTVVGTPSSTIISSTQNRIITIDEFDPLAITVQMIAR